MQRVTLFLLSAVLAVALAEGQYYVPRAYYTIDAEGHASAPVPLRRLRRSLNPSSYPGASATANAEANANAVGGGTASAHASANARADNGYIASAPLTRGLGVLQGHGSSKLLGAY